LLSGLVFAPVPDEPELRDEKVAWCPVLSALVAFRTGVVEISTYVNTGVEVPAAGAVRVAIPDEAPSGKHPKSGRLPDGLVRNALRSWSELTDRHAKVSVEVYLCRMTACLADF